LVILSKIVNVNVPAQRNIRIHSDEQHAIPSHELQSALMLTVEFSKMYYSR
jgi:hypothetical protein